MGPGSCDCWVAYVPVDEDQVTLPSSWFNRQFRQPPILAAELNGGVMPRVELEVERTPFRRPCGHDQDLVVGFPAHTKRIVQARYDIWY